MHERAEQRVRGRGQGPDQQLRGRVRHRGRERAGGHQERQLRVPRLASSTTCATTSSPPTSARATIAGPGQTEDKYHYPGLHPLRARSSSPAPTSTRTATRRSSSSAGSGSARRWRRIAIFDVVPTRGHAQRATSTTSAAARTSNQGHHGEHPARLPGRRHAGAQRQPVALHRPDRPRAHQPVPAAELQRPQQPLQLHLQPAGGREPQPGRRCASTTTSPTTPAPTSAWPATPEVHRERPRPLVAAGRASSCPRPSRARSVGQLRGVEPDERALADHHQRDPLQLQPAEARQPLPGPRGGQPGRIGAAGLENPFGGSGIHPGHRQRVLGRRGRGSMWVAQDVENIFAYNGFLRLGDNFTKVLNTHAIKIGGIVERQYKQQNFQHQNNIQLIFAQLGQRQHRQRVRRPAGGPPGAGRRRHSRPRSATSWPGTSSSTSRTRGRCRRTSRWSTASASASGRTTPRPNGLGARVHPRALRPERGPFLVARQPPAERLRLRLDGPGRTRASPTPGRSLFMPRVNFAWDLSGNGNTVFRGGGGIFFNREAGNAQYGIINIPPNSYRVDAGRRRPSRASRTARGSTTTRSAASTR